MGVGIRLAGDDDGDDDDDDVGKLIYRMRWILSEHRSTTTAMPEWPIQ